MKKIIVEGHLDVPAEDLAAVKEALPTHIALTRNEAGCLVFKVEQDPECANRFQVYEEFESESAFDAHQTRVKNSAWSRLTRNARRDYNIRRQSSG